MLKPPSLDAYASYFAIAARTLEPLEVQAVRSMRMALGNAVRAADSE
jgi:hypothetical protein